MKRILIVIAVLFLSAGTKAQEDHTTYLGVGAGFIVAGGIVHASSLIEGNASDRQSVRMTNRIGTVMGLIGFASFTYGAVLTRDKSKLELITSSNGIGLRLSF